MMTKRGLAKKCKFFLILGLDKTEVMLYIGAVGENEKMAIKVSGKTLNEVKIEEVSGKELGDRNCDMKNARKAEEQMNKKSLLENQNKLNEIRKEESNKNAVNKAESEKQHKYDAYGGKRNFQYLQRYANWKRKQLEKERPSKSL